MQRRRPAKLITIRAYNKQISNRLNRSGERENVNHTKDIIALPQNYASFSNTIFISLFCDEIEANLGKM
jgi:hypothetical protein